MCTMTVEEPPVKSEPSEKSVKTKLKEYRQKLMTIKARIRYREQAIKNFRKHLKNGTFPQRMKSIKPYPKMSSPEAQNIVNAACDQVQQRKLTEDQDSYQALLDQRQGDRQQLKKPQKSKKPTMAQVQQELTELQSKYAQLCTKLETLSE